MAFSWAEYLDLAKELAGVQHREARTEADARSSISRAYYAAYGSARNRLRHQDGLVIPGGPVGHSFVSGQFQNAAETARKAVGANLDRLRIARNRADYDDVFPQLAVWVGVTLQWAEEILEDLGRLGA